MAPKTGTRESKPEPKITAEMVKPLPPLDSCEPGRWGYFCKKCGKIALIFPGEDMPNMMKPIEEMLYLRVGRFKSKMRTEPVCGHCNNRLDFEAYNHLKPARIFDVDSWFSAKGISMTKLGFPEREKRDGQRIVLKGGEVFTIEKVTPEEMMEHTQKCTEEIQNAERGEDL